MIAGQQHFDGRVFSSLMTSTWFIGIMAVMFMLPTLPTIAEQFHTTATLTKYTISVFLFGKAAGMLVFGPLSEKYGRRLFMLIGISIFTLGNVLAFIANDIYALILARLIQGLGVSASVLMGRVMINDLYKCNKAAVVFSHVFLAASIIIMFLPYLGSQIASHFSWRTTFLVMGAYSLLILILHYFFLPETKMCNASDKLSIRQITQHYKTILSHPLFLGYVLCSIFMIAGESAFNTASSFLLIKSLGVTTNHFGLLMTTLAIGHFVGTLLCGVLVKRYNIVNMMGTGVIILAVSTLAMTVFIHLGFVNVAMIIVPMIIFYVGTGFVMTITAVGAVIPFPKLIGISSAASLMLNFSFSAGSSLIMSHLPTHTASPVSLLIAVCGLCAALSWLLLILPQSKTSPDYSTVTDFAKLRG